MYYQGYTQAYSALLLNSDLSKEGSSGKKITIEVSGVNYIKLALSPSLVAASIFLSSSICNVKSLGGICVGVTELV